MILSAGAVRANFSGMDLRNVCIDGVEVAQRIYTAVRDPIWGTVAPVYEDIATDIPGSEFTVKLSTRCTDAEIDYRQETMYRVSAEDDVLRCQLDGVALRDFRYNRIGFCILLDQSMAGCHYRIWHPGAKEEEGILSQLVAPQLEIGGNLFPYLGPFEALQLELHSGGVVRYAFRGDVFELEDQRNWTDSSFKVYSTPLEAGWPLRAETGNTFSQTLEVSFQPAVPLRQRNVRKKIGDRVSLALGPLADRALPRLGSNLGGVTDMSESQKKLLQRLKLDHLRLDMRLGHDFPSVGESTAVVCRELDIAAEIVIELLADGDRSIGAVGGLIDDLLVDRIIVLQAGVPCTGGEIASRAKSAFLARGREIPCYAGTDLHFADVNRYRPSMDGADGLAFPIVPTVHADDDETVLDNVRAQAEVVISASALCGGRPLALGPITLRPRFSAWAGDNDARSGVGPSDPRQWSLFGAVWTLKSLAVLAQAGVQSVTYHDVVGYQGLLAPSKDGFEVPEIYPVYWLIQWLGEWKGTPMVSSRLSEGSSVTSLALRRGTETRVILGNAATETAAVEIPGVRRAVVRKIHADGVVRSVEQKNDVIVLGKYEVVCADLVG